MLNPMDEVRRIGAQYPKMEETLFTSLMQPFANTDSASRRYMVNKQLEQVVPCINGETPIISTSYEVLFSEYSSSFLRTNTDMILVEKIPRFIGDSNREYIAVFKVLETEEHIALHCKKYIHVSESYGYSLSTDILDKMMTGEKIKAGTVLQKPSCINKYGNRADGVNLRAAYLSINYTTEDAIVISDVTANKLAVKTYDVVQIMLNDNDILLNLYGDNNTYKSFPDIGEEIQNGILCGVRRIKKEEALYSQAYDRLSKVLLSDDTYKVKGKVIDIKIYSNNPDKLYEYYNAQVLNYYDADMKYNDNVYKTLGTYYTNSDNDSQYTLQKEYFDAKRIIEDIPYINDREYSNMMIEITVEDIAIANVGDKLTNRHGGKGVISRIIPQNEMPLLDNGEYLDIIFNDLGIINRAIAGVEFELSTTFIGGRLVEYIEYLMSNDNCSYDDILAIIHDYMIEFSESFASDIRKAITGFSEMEKKVFVDSIISQGAIMLSLEPIQDSLSLEKLEKIYDKFPFIFDAPYKVTVPIEGSDGNLRYVTARKSLYLGKMYTYRLKQTAKATGTSLTSTNIVSEPTKSRALKNYKSSISDTPIKFGDMEFGDMTHMDMESVIKFLMINSSSPEGRMEAKNLYTQDPYNTDIKLNEDAISRSAEVINVYLKTLGLRLSYKKVMVKRNTPFEIRPYMKATYNDNNSAFSIEDKDGNITYSTGETKDEYNAIEFSITHDSDGKKKAFVIFPYEFEYPFHYSDSEGGDIE